MKKATYILSIIILACTNLFAQTDTGYVTGIVKEVKPHFAGQQTLLVNNTELVLISDPKDASGNTFEINNQFKDILIRKDNVFVLNPKYKNLTLKFAYTTNGKGWKCIAKVSYIKPQKASAHSSPTNK